MLWLLAVGVAGLTVFVTGKVIKSRKLPPNDEQEKGMTDAVNDTDNANGNLDSKPTPTPPEGQATTEPQPTPPEEQATTEPQPTPPEGQATTEPQPTPPEEQATTEPQPTPPEGQATTEPQPTPPEGQATSGPTPHPTENLVPPRPRKEEEKRQNTRLSRNNPPGIICWKNHNHQWVVGVEAPSGLTELEVRQDNEPLTKETIPSSGGAKAFACRQPEAPVEADWKEDGKKQSCSSRIPCKKGRFTIFSMKNNWQGIGRRVGHVVTGQCYIIIAPRNWERIGFPQVNDEAFLDDEYRAHYFKPEHGEKDGFRLPNGREEPLDPKRGRFELRGKMPGTHPDAPPLFGSALPKLCDKKNWDGVGEIIVGGDNLDCRARPPFPAHDYDLNTLLAEKPGGLFAVRVDNNNGEGLDAQLDFQFMPGLRAIDIHGVRLLPGPNGHGTAKIAFQGDCEIVPKELRPGVRLSGCAVEVAPHPDNDQTRWEIRNGDAKVEVDILLERVWWARGPEPESQCPNEWGDKPLLLLLEDVSATAAEGLWIKLPRVGFDKKVHIGFAGAMNPYPVTARKSTVFAPLKEFAIAARQGEREIKIRMGDKNEGETAVIARIVAPNARNRAEVVRRGGRRDGKGFSLPELTAAGWDLARARRENLSVDMRRKSVHNWNIDTLTAIGENPQ